MHHAVKEMRTRDRWKSAFRQATFAEAINYTYAVRNVCAYLRSYKSDVPSITQSADHPSESERTREFLHQTISGTASCTDRPVSGILTGPVPTSSSR